MNPSALPFEFECEHLFSLLDRHRGVPSASILAVYLVGSRLYGTASPDADYDFLVIVEDEAYRALPPVELSAQSAHGQPEPMDANSLPTTNAAASTGGGGGCGRPALIGDATNANSSLFAVTRMVEYIPGGTEHFSYVSFEFVLKPPDNGSQLGDRRVIRADCGLYSRTYFSTQLLEHESFALQVVWLPPRCCWKIVRDRCPWEMQLPILSHPKLWRSCIREADRTVVISKRFLEGELYKFKKKLVYSLRIFLFAKQIILSGKILDYTTGNDIYYELINGPLASWAEFQNWYRPKLRELYHEIEAWVDFPLRTVCDKFPLMAMNHICEFGLVSLSRLFSIHFELLECEEETQNGFQLVKLMTLADEPKSTQITKDCRGLILRLPRDVANPSLFENRRTGASECGATDFRGSPGEDDSKAIPPYSIVAYPFAPITAYNSPSELRSLNNFVLDMSSVSVYHKRDGVLCTLYWHCGKWKISFEQLFNYKKEKPNFEELFWRQWHSQGHSLPGEGNSAIAVDARRYNYFFELCGPCVGNVCCYEECFLVLPLEYLGARCMNTFALLSPTGGEFSASHHWHVPPELPLPREQDRSNNHQLIVKYTKTLIEFLWNQTEHLLPHSAEGFVIVLEESSSEHPMKIVRHHWAIKSPCWLAQKAVLLLPKYVITVQPYHFIHVAREYLCQNYFANEKPNSAELAPVAENAEAPDALAIAVARAAEEFARYYPAWSVQFADMCEQIAANFCRNFDSHYLPLVPFLQEETKEFAKRLLALSKDHKPLLFAAKSKQYICAMQIVADFTMLPPQQFEKVVKVNKTTLAKKT